MISAVFNLKKFPIDRPDSGQYKLLVKGLRKKLASDHFVNIEDFLTVSGTSLIAREINKLVPGSFHASRSSNAYGLTEGDSYPADHPYNIKSKTDRFGLGRHQLCNTLLDAVYTWEPVRRFVGDVLNLDQVFLHEDPCNALVVQIYKRGGGIAWHFDQALFSTILNIQETEQGGVFECAPNIRSDDNPCFDNVRDVLLDRSRRVERHKIKAGSFSIMLGRYTLHRV